MFLRRARETPSRLAIESDSSQLWGVVHERDELGSDLVPDYVTAVRDEAFYGWPYRYSGSHIDNGRNRREPAEKAVAPDYALGSHTASPGLAYTAQTALTGRFHEGMFIGQLGSRNRKQRSGYKVIFVPFSAGQPSGDPIDVWTGFVKENGDAMGRPVGVAIDTRGALLVSDDVGNTIWRVTQSEPTRHSAP